MLTISGISLQDVLARRRGQIGMRAGAAIILMVSNGPLLGWPVMCFITGLYCALQAMEFFFLRQERPGRWVGPVTLTALALSALVFGAQAPLLAVKLGNWGLVCGIYVLCASILNVVFLTIGCRAAFLASTLPFFVYLAILPYISLLRHETPPFLVMFELCLGGVYFILNVAQLWATGSRGKLAELLAEIGRAHV